MEGLDRCNMNVPRGGWRFFALVKLTVATVSSRFEEILINSEDLIHPSLLNEATAHLNLGQKFPHTRFGNTHTQSP
jgi:hypothetical protein